MCLSGPELNHPAETVPTKTERKEKEQKHIRGALKTCGCPNWIFALDLLEGSTDKEMENLATLSVGPRRTLVVHYEKTAVAHKHPMSTAAQHRYSTVWGEPCTDTETCPC